MDIMRVESVDHLKEMTTTHGMHDYFIALNFGLRSSKMIYFRDGVFDIINEIDDTEQTLTPEQLMDKSLTNIGYAISKGALYAYGM